MDRVPDKIHPPKGPRRPAVYKIHEKLGEGSYGKVYRVVSSNQNQEFALKIINLADIKKDGREILNILSEISILASITHNNIIKYYDSWQTTENVYIVTEYYENLDLWRYVKKEGTPTEPQLIEWIRQLASALMHLQERSIFHRNITPQNVMVSKDLTLKLGDFGTAKQLSCGDVTNTVTGTPYYMSPEMLRQEPYNVKADIWSFGCLCYALMTGCVLHEGESIQALRIASRTGTSLEKLRSSQIWSDDLKVLVIQMLSQEPSDRPTVESILTSPVVSENIFDAPSSVTAVAETARYQNVERCDSSKKISIPYEFLNKEDRPHLDVKIEERKERNVTNKSRAPMRSESQEEHTLIDKFSKWHNLAETCPPNMRFFTKTPDLHSGASQEVGRQSDGAEGRVNEQACQAEQQCGCQGQSREGEDQIQQEDQSVDLCELKIQQWLCKNLGEDVYRAGLACLLEPDETTAIGLLENAIGQENFNSYFYYFLILMSIYKRQDCNNIIQNTLKAMSDNDKVQC